ncbi:MAG: outer membrane beta-barrel protein [Sulfurovum sp.]|nr:outer membrane beta-barrel protein [Sulfurovum sp.]
MKKNVLSLLAVLAVSGLAYAGGDYIEAEPIPIPAVDYSAFYIGAGVGQGVVNNDQSQEEMTSTTLMLQAGYQYNQYVALEGRYTFGFNMDYDSGITRNISDDYDGDFSAWGIYVKPMYPIGNFSLYALLGYGGVSLDSLELGDAYESGFQWGLGASYTFEESIVVFADYVQLYDDEGFDYRATLEDVDADTWNIGVSYKF